MKVAITGGTGFVGAHLARRLAAQGHDVVLISRGVDRRDDSIRQLPRSTSASIGLDDVGKLTEAFAGCEAVAHCAGINREIGRQTYARVHVEGTRNVVRAAEAAGVRRLALVSFLRARPGCGSAYHESKFEAEEIVRESALDWTVLKCGVIYGRGDHMLDHLSHAFHTFPVFGLVGFREQLIRPTAVADVVRVLEGALVEGRLSRQTVAVVGPEEMTLTQAVRRVADVAGKRPWMVRLPLWFHYGLGWAIEKVMTVPMVSTAQVRMLSEGLVEPLPATPFVQEVAPELAPETPFTEEQIRRGLPEAKGFGLSDCRFWPKFGRA
jgi:NADH dehydrogenase